MPTDSSKNKLSLLAVRTILLLLLGVVLALPLQAQSQTPEFFELSREIESPLKTVEKEAENVARSKRYLREVSPAGDPTVLILGDLHLSIADAPFIVYLRSTNHHTKVRLESLKLDVTDETIREAKAFLQEVSSRSTS